MKWLAFIIMVLTPVAHAHPLDDRAQMTSEVVIVSDQRLEYVLHFRYLDVIASATEFDAGLDGNRDGEVTSAEIKRRFNVLVDELTFAIGITVDGEPISLQPDFERFVFEDMERTWPPDVAVFTNSARIHYRFVFYWDGPAPLAPGAHTVEYFFNGLQSVVHTPAEQMVALDAREHVRARINEVTHTSVGIPRLSFKWNVEATKRPEVTPPANAPDQPPTEPEPKRTMSDSVTEKNNIPAWLSLTAGLVVAVGGVIVTIRRASEGLKAAAPSALAVLAGLAIVTGALVRLGYIQL